MRLAGRYTCQEQLYGNLNSEKYSRGRRGAPAKGVGRETGARVQIPLSPFGVHDTKIYYQKDLKKC